MSDEHIRIERHELFDPAVDKALARERVGRERIIADAPAASPLRRFLLSSMFYLPLAGVLGALLAWRLIEPSINDRFVVGGEVVLVNAEPFEAPRGVIGLTVGTHEVLVDPTRVVFVSGAHGEPALAGADDLKVGARIEVAGLPVDRKLFAAEIRPTPSAESTGDVERRLWPLFFLFPLTAALVAFSLLLAEGVTTRNWVRMIERTLLCSFLATLFATIALFIPGIFIMAGSDAVLKAVADRSNAVVVTIRDIGAVAFLIHTAFRSVAWACVGAATGVGMNLVRSTRAQLRNSVIGGALGGAFGGMFFDPIDRFSGSTIFDGAATSRGVGLIMVGLSIGVFMALVERLAREAWVRVRTGPLAGKSFILYKTPSIIGNAPQSDIYLYKDAEIDPSHAAIHRVGTTYEIEDLGTRMGTSVGGSRIRRRRLASGDQIVIGSTILDFEERQRRTPAA
ncbi:MAG: FHA domain-containing protein [Deltaproteobacteria bacterium]|nr:MAG: FHA domain-containing protein [Deltaproteobacteria bacterium]TMQ25113.1 MAG: FHA domain-containing protein [Deltaproteobacteria bacterium]